MPTIRFLREQRDIDCPAGVILRDVALDAGVEIYGLKGKLGNCGGCGQCSTCFVAVAGQEEADGLTPRTAPEQRFLRRRPPNWRLACQSVVRDSLVVVTRPQTGWPGGDEALAAAVNTLPVNVMTDPALENPQQDTEPEDGGPEADHAVGQSAGDGVDVVDVVEEAEAREATEDREG